jgi:PadR family transcriptional regulator
LFYFVEAMSKGDYLGEFEQIVLLALSRVGRDAYGMTIRREIEATTGRKVSIGAVYATLDRLATKGYARSRLSAPVSERGGRARRLYELTSEGVTALKRSREILEKMWKGARVEALPKNR